jgi:hypothetical protein
MVNWIGGIASFCAIGSVCSIYCNSTKEIEILKNQIDDFEKKYSLQKYDKPVKDFTGAVWDMRDEKWINVEKKSDGIKASWNDHRKLWQLNPNEKRIYWDKNEYMWKQETDFHEKLETLCRKKISV